MEGVTSEYLSSSGDLVAKESFGDISGWESISLAFFNDSLIIRSTFFLVQATWPGPQCRIFLLPAPGTTRSTSGR